MHRKAMQQAMQKGGGSPPKPWPKDVPCIPCIPMGCMGCKDGFGVSSDGFGVPCIPTGCKDGFRVPCIPTGCKDGFGVPCIPCIPMGCMGCKDGFGVSLNGPWPKPVPSDGQGPEGAPTPFCIALQCNPKPVSLNGSPFC